MRSSENLKTRKLAGQLLALEVGENASIMSDVHAVVSVCDKLRRPLATLAGAVGFRSLLERALSVFEPFFTTKGSIGNGLRLWVCKHIIEKHSGTIRLRSRANGAHGATFSVVLPGELTSPESGTKLLN